MAKSLGLVAQQNLGELSVCFSNKYTCPAHFFSPCHQGNVTGNCSDMPSPQWQWLSAKGETKPNTLACIFLGGREFLHTVGRSINEYSVIENSTEVPPKQTATETGLPTTPSSSLTYCVYIQRKWNQTYTPMFSTALDNNQDLESTWVSTDE